MNRRTLLYRGGLVLAGLAAAEAAPLLRTPAQTEGPFYPVKEPSDTDLDLTVIKGRAERARGQIVVVEGVLKDLDGKPLPQARVELWQACASGRYHHPNDPNPAAQDANFQSFGRVLTDAAGRY